MKHFEKVIYCSSEWFFIEEIDNKYLLKSINKNINDVLAKPQYVKRCDFNKSQKIEK